MGIREMAICTLRAQLLMALHDHGRAEVCSRDPCYPLALILDHCLRDRCGPVWSRGSLRPLTRP